ncbi:MAG TPA: FKBP-type peptidyl-prolyl cis-trans isomerase [Candidatus Latescibacteria bacterium]|jgi:FKBP-type peptidyl-prolyl cis-trans isomerase|nr:peptidylprolyl isomerase [Gemmatimonadaceae bacterium]MDP6017727.1 FKBP-type peptidyl-prolyl cis-trans isomerase [Candidatus Latescibacterota bacterium]HJP34245.1 FKBP-type peptidyl-prolyl cis-trans isomerase [Candidatus Latescibacterota bacterium]|tara:strand:- start:155 stop:856 length:702 start_codon:yes stop_codon:yes gene_type:complete
MPSTLKASAAACLITLVILSGCDQVGSASSAPRPLVTAQDSTLYAVGHGLAGQFNLHELFTVEELELVNQGFNDGVLGSGEFGLENYLESMNLLISQRRAARAGRLQAAGDAFVAEAGQQEGAVTTPSGLVYIEQEAGTGETPTDSSTVRVHYEGSFSNGTIFDSSYRRDEPMEFHIRQVIAGWTEGLQLMKVGGKAKLVIPANLGYGEAGHAPGIPPNVPLVFIVELLAVTK